HVPRERRQRTRLGLAATVASDRDAGVRLRPNTARVRKPVKLEMVLSPVACHEGIEHVFEASGRLDRVEEVARHALECEGDDDAERAEPEGDGWEQLRAFSLGDG